LLRQEHGRDVWFLGKTLVASAGVTVMAAFPKAKRWLTRDSALLIHGRRMVKDLHLEGPLGSCRRARSRADSRVHLSCLLFSPPTMF
jgi:ATP-dependent protease ClpP protease subunit